jgi:hypothetical protein
MELKQKSALRRGYNLIYNIPSFTEIRLDRELAHAEIVSNRGLLELHI